MVKEKTGSIVRIENKTAIKLLICAIFVLILSVLLNVKPGVNNSICQVYYFLSVLGLLILFLKYSRLKGIYIDEDKVNKCYNFADLLSIFIITSTIFQFIFVFLFFPARVNGESMEPTFHNEQFIIVSSNNDVKNFDVVVIEYKKTDIITTLKDGELLIKRVIAKGGDTFYYLNGELYLNGENVKEDYLDCIPKDIKIDDFKNYEGIVYDEVNKKYIVQDGYYFVLGDNRKNSNDSEELGLFKESQILGKVEYKSQGFLKFEKVN